MSALSDRDTNVQTVSTPQTTEKQVMTAEENKIQDPQQHRQVLEQKIAENNAKPGQNYISPSDAILSPASQKLSNMKQRQMDKQNTKTPLSRALFARTPSSCSNGFDSIEGSGAAQ